MSPCSDLGPVSASRATAELAGSTLAALAAAELTRKLRRLAIAGVRMIALLSARLTLVTGIGERTCDRDIPRMPA